MTNQQPEPSPSNGLTTPGDLLSSVAPKPSPVIEPATSYSAEPAPGYGLPAYAPQPLYSHPYPTQAYAPYPLQPYGYPARPVQHGYFIPQQLEHPMSTAVLVLGLLGMVFWTPAVVALILGAKAKRDIAQGAPYRFGAKGQVGFILGIVFTAIMVLCVGATFIAKLATF